jgi:hypothetical protein
VPLAFCFMNLGLESFRLGKKETIFGKDT